MKDIDKNEPKNDRTFRYILVGNIIDKHFVGEEIEIKSGTKLFRPGAKVFLFPKYAGMGHEAMPVFGLPRKSGRRIHIVIRSEMIKNVRVKQTCDQKLITLIAESYFYAQHNNNASELSFFAEALNQQHKELS